jgi:polysaccharide biosynthesis protein PslH
MKLIHVLLAEPGGQVSGRELRDCANYEDMIRTATVVQFLIDDFLYQKRVKGHSSTVVNVSDHAIEALMREVERIQPDGVVFEGVALLHVIEAVRRLHPALPIAVDFHNVEGTLYRNLREARIPQFLRPLIRTVVSSGYKAAEIADRRVVALSTMVWVCSEDDRSSVLEFAPTSDVVTVPNPIPDWGFQEGPVTEEPRTEVVFVGHLGYDPNKFAVRFLADKLAPLLAQRVPQARLHVCGRNPSRKLVHFLRRHGVKVTENPATLAPIYGAAAVAAIPLRHGGGTRIKVLEAMAAGCPIVATAKAVEGLGMEPGRHYLLAESAREFATEIARVFEDSSLRDALRESGRVFVHSRFSAEARTQAVRSALNRLVATAVADGGAPAAVTSDV